VSSAQSSHGTPKGWVKCPTCETFRPHQTIRSNLTCDECETLEVRLSTVPHKIRWDDVRAQRDALVRQCDWVDMPNAIARLGAEKHAEWIEYREILFDITKIFGNPWEVVFPERPKT